MFCCAIDYLICHMKDAIGGPEHQTGEISRYQQYHFRIFMHHHKWNVFIS